MARGRTAPSVKELASGMMEVRMAGTLVYCWKAASSGLPVARPMAWLRVMALVLHKEIGGLADYTYAITRSPFLKFLTSEPTS